MKNENVAIKLVGKVGLNRRLKMIAKHNEELKKLKNEFNKERNARIKAQDAINRELALWMDKKNEYLIEMEKRLSKVETMPSVDGDKLLDKVENLHSIIKKIDKNTMKFKRQDEEQVPELENLDSENVESAE